MILLTKNLIIRTLSQDDLYQLAPLLADEDMMRFSLTGPLKKEAEAKEYLQRIIEHHSKFGFGLYAIVHKDSERLIGIVGFFSQNVLGESKIELAYRLDPEFWGKGLGSEATFAIANHAFNQLHIEELISIIDPRNTRSLLFAKRVGMEFWRDTTFSDIPVRIFVLNKVTVVPYLAEWKTFFKDERNRLIRTIKKDKAEFYHVGCTAVSGSFARPVIDIIGTVPDLTEINAHENPLFELGYQLNDDRGLQGIHYIKKSGTISYNLTLLEETDPEVERSLRFTDYLKKHSATMKAYSEFKMNLSKEFASSLIKYTKEKEKFIKEIDIKAAEEIHEKLSKSESPVKKKTWTPTEIQKAIEANMGLHLTYFPKYVSTSEIINQSDVTAVLAPIKDDTFNYVFSARFSKNNAKKRVIDTITLYADRNLPFSWWVGPSDAPIELETFLLESDLQLKEENIGMSYDMVDLSSKISEPKIIFEHVLNSEQLEEFTHVLGTVGVSKDTYSIFYSKIPPLLYQNGANVEIYLGKVNGRGVVTGIVLFYANAAGIYFVATNPSERKKGYGTAMMQRLMSRAKERGYHLVVLQASKDGKELYERLGFKESSIFKEYVWR